MLALLVALTLGAPAPDAAPQPRFDAAYAALLEGRLADAAAGFGAVAADPAAPPALAERARTLASACLDLAARGAFVPRPADAPLTPAPGPGRPPRLDQRGRGELALYATGYGVWTGIAAGILFQADDPRAFAALALAGGGGALALSTLGTRGREVSAGRAQAIEAAASWGSLNGGLVAGIARAGERGVVGTTLGVGLAGLGAAALLTERHAPSSGDVALATSGSTWGLAAGALALTFVDSPGDRTVMATLLAGSDLGLAAMILAGRKVEISRGRSLLVDAGGVVGSLVGLAVPLFAKSENPKAYGVGGLLGMGAGLAAGWHLTRDWDDDAGDERRAGAAGAAPFVVRTPSGGVTVGLAGRY